MPRPKKGEPLSQTPRAIRERENRRKNKVNKEAAIQEIELPAPNINSEVIGVVDTDVNEPEIDVYTCGNCGAVIDWGDDSCNVCEQSLNFEGINNDTE